ncbi:MAG: hypothetical protein H6873_01115 [Hyphomicrobiaceae bacterium]|nr:hypothetical protein [Hyphomicrobiaceae bacterium]
MKSYKSIDISNKTEEDFKELVVDFIDMGDGTHERVEMPFAHWWMLEEIVTDRCRPMSEIIEEVRGYEAQGLGYSFGQILQDWLSDYGQGMIDSGQVAAPVPIAPKASGEND